MMYEITQDCRIANVDYKKGQIVTQKEVGGLFFSVMREATADAVTPEEPTTGSKWAKKGKKADENPADPTPEADAVTPEESTEPAKDAE